MKAIKILLILLFVSELASAQTINIIGGNDININQAPWQILFEINGNDACGGSILNEQWIVTAAHCICETNANTSNTRVIAGITRRSQKNNGQIRGISEILVHPNYNCVTNNTDFDADIALLRLSTPLTFNPDVQPINIARINDAVAGLLDPEVDAFITGWGGVDNNGNRPDNLQGATLPIISNQDAINLGSQVTGNMIALFEAGIAAAPGDSGGPMVVPDGGNGFILGGVSSWGFFPKDQNPTIYTRVSNYCNWILQNTTAATISGPFALCTSNSTFTLQNAPQGLPITWSVAPANLFAVDNGTGLNFTTRATNSSSNGTGTVTATITTECGDITFERDVWVGKPTINPDWQGINSVIAMTPNAFKGASPFPCISTLSDHPKTYYWEIDPDHVYRVQGEGGFIWQFAHYDATAFYTEDHFGGSSGLYMDLISFQQYGNGYSVVLAENDCGTVQVASMGWGICSQYYSYAVSPNPTSGEMALTFEPVTDPVLTKALNETEQDSELSKTDQPMVREGDEMTCVFFDGNGGKLFEKTITAGQDTRFDLSPYRRGLYHVNIITSSGLRAMTLMKE